MKTLKLNNNLILNLLTIDRMKTRTATLIALFATFMLLVGIQDAQAQKFSATLNYNNQDRMNVPTSNGDIQVRSANLSLNARYYTGSKFAFRAGVGLENLEYSVNTTDGLSSDFESKRKDLEGLFGLEWHPTLGKSIDIYPGLYIPVTVVGDDLINSNLDNLTGDGFSAGLGAVIGANVKLLKIFRVGVEFDARYQNFKAATVNAVNEFSLQPYRGMTYTTNFTVGIMI